MHDFIKESIFNTSKIKYMNEVSYFQDEETLTLMENMHFTYKSVVNTQSPILTLLDQRKYSWRLNKSTTKNKLALF